MNPSTTLRGVILGVACIGLLLGSALCWRFADHDKGKTNFHTDKVEKFLAYEASVFIYVAICGIIGYVGLRRGDERLSSIMCAVMAGLLYFIVASSINYSASLVYANFNRLYIKHYSFLLSDPQEKDLKLMISGTSIGFVASVLAILAIAPAGGPAQAKSGGILSLLGLVGGLVATIIGAITYLQSELLNLQTTSSSDFAFVFSSCMICLVVAFCTLFGIVHRAWDMLAGACVISLSSGMFVVSRSLAYLTPSVITRTPQHEIDQFKSGASLLLIGQVCFVASIALGALLGAKN